jgi:hypothetical protein
MKTSNQTTATKTTSNTAARVHSFLVVAGILTAIICAFVLSQDTHSSNKAEAHEFSVNATTIKASVIPASSALRLTFKTLFSQR